MNEAPENSPPANTEGTVPPVTGQVEQGQAATTQTPVEGVKNWFDTLSDEDKGFLQNKGWNTEDGTQKMLQSYRNLERLRGVPEDRLLQLPKEDDQDGWAKVFNKLGKPEKADDYKFEADENLKIDEGRLNWFKEIAHGNNLTQKQYEKLITADREYQTKIFEEQKNRISTQQEQQIKDLKDAWGNAFDERVELGKRGLKAIGADLDTVDKLEQLIGNSADVTRLFAKIGELTSEGKMHADESGRPFGYTPEQAKNDIADLISDLKASTNKQRLSDYNKQVGADYKKMQDLRKIAYGG